MQRHGCSKLTVSVCFYHSCLATCKVGCQSLQEILTIKEYLIHISLSIFGHNLRTRFLPDMQFYIMLKDHKHFYFTSFPEKINDTISLKNLKTLFPYHFDIFSHFFLIFLMFRHTNHQMAL